MTAPRVGVLALQGSFVEHSASLAAVGVTPVEVRKAEQLDGLLGLIIPGGESTTMALVAERWGLVRLALRNVTAPAHALQLPALRAFAASGRPVWGTCAGLIFLADRALGAPASLAGCLAAAHEAARPEAGRPGAGRRPGRDGVAKLFRQPGAELRDGAAVSALLRRARGRRGGCRALQGSLHPSARCGFVGRGRRGAGRVRRAAGQASPRAGSVERRGGRAPGIAAGHSVPPRADGGHTVAPPLPLHVQNRSCCASRTMRLRSSPSGER